MSRPVQEFLPRGQGLAALRGMEEREHGRRTLDAVRLVLPEDPISEPLETDNVLVLAGGAHGGGHLLRPFTRLFGLGDCRVERQLRIEADAIVQDIRFLSSRRNADRDNASILVSVEGTARVVFNGCAFEKDARDPMSAVAADRECYVVVENGAKATFQGCVFKGTPAAGLIVNHVAGPAGDVQIVGCLNTTGQAHGGVTTVAEIT